MSVDLICDGCDEDIAVAGQGRCANCLAEDAKDAARGPQGLGFTYHLDECPKSRGSISGCICRDDEHAELTRESP